MQKILRSGECFELWEREFQDPNSGENGSLKSTVKHCINYSVISLSQYNIYDGKSLLTILELHKSSLSVYSVELRHQKSEESLF